MNNTSFKSYCCSSVYIGFRAYCGNRKCLTKNFVQVSRPQKCLFMHMHEWSSFQNKSQILVPLSFQPKKSQQFKHWSLF